MRKKITSFLVLIIFIAPAAYAKVTIQKWMTDSGAEVSYVYAPQLPMVDIMLAFNAGSARDGDKPGIANLTNSMLNEGTTTLNAQQIAARFDKIGANYRAQSKRDMAVVTLRCLTDPRILQSALTLFTDIVSHPSFPPEALHRVALNTVAAIKAEQQSPQDVADKLFYHALYGQHPYAHAILGAPKTVAAMTSEQLQAFYRTYYVAKNVNIAIVGDVNPSQAKQIANQLTHELVVGEHAPQLPSEDNLHKAVIENFNFPATQTQIRIGQLGISRHDPDYFPLYVGNHILGGDSLVSRLSDEVRQKRGLSYDVYSYFLPMAQRGPFIISLGTRNQQAKQALDIVQQSLVNFIDNGPSQGEVTAAKKNIIGSFPLSLNSNKAIANYLLMIGFYHLPLDYLDTFQHKVSQVTRKQVIDAFKRRLQPTKMVTIQVGKSS